MKGKYQVIYRHSASNDMDNIYAYIAYQLREKGTAKKQMRRLYQSIRDLDVFPERYPKMDWEPWASLGFRKMSVDRYVVIYQVDVKKKTVGIARVVYGGRDIEHTISAEWD